MNVNVLIVADYEIPRTTLDYFELQGFHTQITRGPLKTRQTIEHTDIDAILWYSLEPKNALSQDLIKVFNQFTHIPVIAVIVGFSAVNFQKKLKGYFKSIDIAESKEEYGKIIENACNQYRLGQETVVEKSATQETDFCNAVQQAISDKNTPHKKTSPLLNPSTPWIALDNREKKMLAEISTSTMTLTEKSSASFWNKIQRWFRFS